MSRLALLALVAAAAAAASQDYVLPEGHFALRPPRGWTVSRDERQDARQRVYGARLTGPRSRDGVLTVVDVAYYAADNTLFRGGLDEFLKRQFGDDERFVKPAGEKTEPARDATLAGRPARRFARHAFEYLPPDRGDAARVAVTEEVYAAAAKSGFHVVTFRASDAVYAKQKARFAAVLSSLRLDP